MMVLLLFALLISSAGVWSAGDGEAVQTVGEAESTPDGQPGTPDGQPGTPDGQPSTPNSTPSTPDSQPSTPESQPSTPESQPSTPESQPSTPDSTPSTPDSTPSTPDSTPSTPDSTPSTPDSTPDSTPSTPDSTPSTPDSTPSTPDSKPGKPDSGSGSGNSKIGEKEKEKIRNAIHQIRGELAAFRATPTLEKAEDMLSLINGVLSAINILPSDVRNMSEIAAATGELKNRKKELSSAIKELNSAKKKIDAGEKKYAESEAALRKKIKEANLPAARAELDRGWNKLAASRETLDQNWALYRTKRAEALSLIEDAKSQLSSGKAKYGKEKAEAKDKLQTGRSDLTGGWQTYDREKENARTQIESGRAELESGRAQYETQKDDADKQLADGRKELAEGKAQYAAEKESADQQIIEGRGKAAAGRKEYEEEKEKAESKLSEAREELDGKWTEYNTEKEKAEKKLADARKRIDHLDDARFIVTNRRTNESFVHLKSSIQSIFGFATFFVPMFAVIGSLVIFSTMAIIIDEQKKQVGALKAMGFRTGEIRAKYLVFGISAAVIGVTLGIGLCMVVTNIIMVVLRKLYVFGRIKALFVPGTAAIVGGATLVVASSVVWYSCRNLLKCTAVGLMNGSEPAKKSMKGKAPSKGRGGQSLYSRLIVRNILTDMKRVLVSIVVVVGSVMLIGIGFTIRFSFNNAFDYQEKEIYRYSFRVDLGADPVEADKEKVEAIFKDHGASYLPVAYQTSLYECADESAGFYILSAENEQLKEFVHLSSELPESGILLPEKFLEMHSLFAEDTLILYDGALVPHKAKVNGSFRYHAGFMAVMSPAAYREIFGEDPVRNSYYCRLGDAAEEVAAAIKAACPSAQFERPADFAARYESTKKLFNLVALIMVIISVTDTLLIMINLTNILVNRRMKELLVMKVNGFSAEQVKGYLLRETMLINVAGIVLGLIAGILMSGSIIRSIESDYTMYIRTVSILSWGISIAINGVLSFVINHVSFKNIEKTPLTDIMKY